MSDVAVSYMNELAERGHEPLLAKTTGTVAFDLTTGDKTDTWRIVIDRGDLDVRHEDGPADGRLRVDRQLFMRLARGETNPMAASLRGEIILDGNPDLLLLVQRLFPGPRPVDATRAVDGAAAGARP
jgi:putative sterol carrier protein